MIGPDAELVQSMLFIKSENMPGQAWHQDESHIPTCDRSLTGVWIALDDAAVDNGCLWVMSAESPLPWTTDVMRPYVRPLAAAAARST